MAEFEQLCDWKYFLILAGSMCAGLVSSVMFSNVILSGITRSKDIDTLIAIMGFLIGIGLFALISIKWSEP
jgi:hypothetical protein